MGSDAVSGVVLGHVDLGEADRIVRLLTAEEGRISLLARGARSSRKRFGGLLDLGMRVRVERARGRGLLARIADVELVEAVDRARTEIERIALLAYGCELVGRLAGEDVPAPRLAHLLVVWLELLEGEAMPGSASRQSLEGKALTFSGLLPSLTTCAACDQPLEGGVRFDYEHGPVHVECGLGTPVTAAALARLEELRRTPLFETPGQAPSPAGWVLAEHAQHQLGGVLKSRGLLADLALP
ncbi:MAG: DNA repair protein RecO [Alphaproteobacteria bacterium]|nr:DNA repair protein RecO [Alphaproteobacteria bacterium]